jgi:Arylsulfotransferase (ASST)
MPGSMQRIRYILVFVFLIPFSLFAQVVPKEGSQLNYRLIGFSFPEKKGVSNYTIEIAAGNHAVEDSFNKHIFEKVQSKKNRIIIEVPSFGSSYTWRVVYPGANPGAAKSGFCHFSTLTIPEVDRSKFRLAVKTEAKAYKDAYVFVDASRVLYDMNGKPIWFLPYVDGENTQPRDLKLSSRGTITFLTGHKIYEVNYNGDILWRGPNDGQVSGTGTEAYHHEFTRLKNGHYMVLGDEQAYVSFPSRGDSTMRYVSAGNLNRKNKQITYQSTMMATLIEYDERGSVFWSWRAAKYYEGSEVDSQRNPTGSKVPNMDIHGNAFYFNDKTNEIYVSFKNINSIIKIKYPEGKVVNDHGDKFKRGFPKKVNDLFCGQHSCGYTQKGNLYTFNNNDCSMTSGSKLVVMQEPVGRKGKLKTVWEFECPMDNIPVVNMPVKMKATSGGCVQELPDQSLFAIMSAMECKLFIVNMNKEILWSALPEKWNEEQKIWQLNYGSYRANLIFNARNMEQLIWGENIN